MKLTEREIEALLELLDNAPAQGPRKREWIVVKHGLVAKLLVETAEPDPGPPAPK